MKQSAGLLNYRLTTGTPEILLVHPGGPFYKNKDAGAWSLPKGEFEGDEEPLSVAIRELEEETGNRIKSDKFTALTPVRSKGGKIVYAWACESDFEQAFIRSNEFELEWPPRSGKKQWFPEVDQAEWFTLSEASSKVFTYQLPFLNELESLLARQSQDISGHENRP